MPVPPVQPWTPPAVEPADIWAIKALYQGKASEGQQKRALDLIINRIAATYDLAFRPGGPEGERTTCFASGKQFVGQQVVRLINFDTRLLKPGDREPTT